MKFILVMVLVASNGTSSIATAEFDDLQACEAAGLLATQLIPGGRTVLNRQCMPKATKK